MVITMVPALVLGVGDAAKGASVTNRAVRVRTVPLGWTGGTGGQKLRPGSHRQSSL